MGRAGTEGTEDGQCSRVPEQGTWPQAHGGALAGPRRGHAGLAAQGNCRCDDEHRQVRQRAPAEDGAHQQQAERQEQAERQFARTPAHRHEAERRQQRQGEARRAVERTGDRVRAPRQRGQDGDAAAEVHQQGTAALPQQGQDRRRQQPHREPRQRQALGGQAGERHARRDPGRQRLLQLQRRRGRAAHRSSVTSSAVPAGSRSSDWSRWPPAAIQ
jgi:hypothetical protein